MKPKGAASRRSRAAGVTRASGATGIDAYIAAFPPRVRTILVRIRSVIRRTAPRAQEKISYGIPAFAMDGDLIYFAAFKSHIGIYPPVKGDERLRRAIARYAGEKGNLKFPLDEPIPYDLIGGVVRARIREHRARQTKARERKKR